MTLQEVVDLVLGSYGARYQLDRDQVLRFVNMIQKIAFTKDVDGHLVYDTAFVAINELTFAVHADLVDADVGLGVVGGTSGFTGTLRYYNNTTKKWGVEVLTGTPADGENVTVTGGTAGTRTLAASDALSVYQGPYDFPTDPAARKVIGVTAVTDAQLFKDPSVNIDTDYGMVPSDIDERKIFLVARQNKLAKTISFTFALDVAETYRWVYYRAAPDIQTEEDVDAFIFPEEYHHTTILQGVQVLANNALNGDLAPMAALEPLLQPYWEEMEDVFTPFGDSSNQTSEGQP